MNILRRADMSSKRELLISTAFTLFYQKGIHAVGINEILAESGVAKKTLYNHFPSKEALLLAVLQYRDEVYCQWLQTEFDKADKGVAKIDALFSALDHWFNDRTQVLALFHGCFFINVSAEYGELNNPIRQQCIRHKARVEDMIRECVKTLVEDPGCIAEITQALCLLKEGAIVKAYVQGDKQSALKAREIAIKIVL
jgi:AcrR family transcriptional regulator